MVKGKQSTKLVPCGHVVKLSNTCTYHFYRSQGFIICPAHETLVLIALAFAARIHKALM